MKPEVFGGARKIFESENSEIFSYLFLVLGLLVELVMGEGLEKNIGRVLPVTRSILQSALGALADGERNMSVEPVAPFWKEAYYSLVLFEKIMTCALTAILRFIFFRFELLQRATNLLDLGTRTLGDYVVDELSRWIKWFNC